jgi:glycine cleavage system H protein
MEKEPGAGAPIAGDSPAPHSLGVEPSWRGCLFPTDLLYEIEHHVWVRPTGDEVVLGMTDVAQTLGGKLVAITWKEAGVGAVRGRPLAAIESAKWVGPFVSPVDGVVVANNSESFARDPALANRDPYGKGWLYRIAIDRDRLASWGLRDADQAYREYVRFIDENDIHCFRCEE